MIPGDLGKKLIRVERTINIYDLNNKLIREIPVVISIDSIKKLIPQCADDPNYYDGYKLTENQALLITKHLLEKIEINIEKYNYYMVAGGIYNW